jgi:uncharacterized protein
MDFRDDVDLDASQVEDRGGGGLPTGGLMIGGGAIGIVALVVALITGVNPLGLLGGDEAPPADPGTLPPI